jgi:hypothetical protein
MMTGDIIVGAAKHARDWVDYWTVGATVAGAAILLAYTIAAFRQATLTARALREAEKSREETTAAALRSDDAAKKSNEIATRALELGRRAWLVPSLDFKSLVEAGAERRVVVYIANTGGVPGVIEEARAAVTVEGIVRQEFIGFGGTIVTPGQSPQDSLVITIHPSATYQEIASPETPISVTCRVEYTDVFRKRRETEIGWDRYKGDKWLIKGGTVLT